MLSYKEVYQTDDVPELSELLRDVPAAPAIEKISSMLVQLISRKGGNNQFHFQQLISWMFKLTRDDVMIFTEIMNRNHLATNVNFILTDRVVYISLLQSLLLYAKGTDLEISKEQEASVFKALLILNGEHLAKQEDLYHWDGKGSVDDYLNFILPLMIQNLDIKRYRDYKIELIKVYYFFEFCLSDKDYQAYLNLFLLHHKKKSYEGYILSVLDPYLKMSVTDPPANHFQVDTRNHAMTDFFEQYAINGKVIVDRQDFPTIRAFPFYRSSPGNYHVLHVGFFMDKLYQSLLFEFVRIQQAAGVKMNVATFKTELGTRFSEKIMFYRIMKNCFSGYGKPNLTGTELKDILGEGEPDYYIRDGAKLFLFEFKDIMINADIKNSGDAAVIKKALSEKLETAIDLKKGTEKDVGIVQLLNSIKLICDDHYRHVGIDDFDTQQLMIYPIIVHTETSLEADGVNYYLNQRLLHHIQLTSLPQRRIKPLVMINLNTLIFYQDYFASHKLNLAGCIKSYLSHISTGKPENKLFSFDEHLKHSLKDKGLSFLNIPKDFQRIMDDFVISGKAI